VQILPTVPTFEEGRQAFEKIFRMVATDDQEALALDDYIAREHNGKKLTVVYTDAYYRRPMIETMMRGLPPAMQKSAQFEPLLDSTSTYDRLADKLARSAPDVIYLALDNNMVLELVTKLRKAGVKSLLIGGQRLLSQEFWRSAREAAEGIYVIAPIESLDDPEFGKALGFLGEANVVPDLVALNSYAAVQAWAEAVRRAGSSDGARVTEALRTGEFKTAVGTVAFDAQGSRRGIKYSVLAWQGGRLRPRGAGKP
jgi:branched-chain amino acid transport system substrate-binding protein